MKKIALITGATSGIGEATARLLSENDYNLILTGRRKDRLTLLEKEILSESDARVKILCFDIRDNDQVIEALESLPEEWQNIDVLVNNAGLAVGLNFFHEGLVDDWERMIDTNVKGLLYISREVSRKMVERKSGHIINLASIAGKEAYEKGNVYVATKHAVDALSRSMRLDLAAHGVKVSNIAPGAVDTEFSTVRFKGDKERADSVYKGFTPLYAEDIAETILFALSRPPHVNICDLLIMPSAQASASVTHRNAD